MHTQHFSTKPVMAPLCPPSLPCIRFASWSGYTIVQHLEVGGRTGPDSVPCARVSPTQGCRRSHRPQKSWDESDLDADEFSEWVSSFTLSGDFLDWCDDCGGPVFYPSSPMAALGSLQVLPRRQLRHMRLL